MSALKISSSEVWNFDYLGHKRLQNHMQNSTLHILLWEEDKALQVTKLFELLSSVISLWCEQAEVLLYAPTTLVLSLKRSVMNIVGWTGHSCSKYYIRCIIVISVDILNYI